MDGEKLVRHLSQNTIRIPSEYQLFLSLDKWFRYQANRFAQDSAKLVGNIRFGLMSEQRVDSYQGHDTHQAMPDWTGSTGHGLPLSHG
ncbi:hypothetical protein Btru_045820 [Bulinus truncatus]|nr:hypothetical protein Btru_045820 [Bulinus truncatus]